MVQNCHNSWIFGEQTCTITDSGSHFEFKIFMFAIIEARLHPEGCKKGAKMKGEGLRS